MPELRAGVRPDRLPLEVPTLPIQARLLRRCATVTETVLLLCGVVLIVVIGAFLLR